MDYEFGKALNVYGFYEIPKVYFERPAAKLLLEGKVYEPRTISFIRNLAGDGSVVSGGAFIGDFLPAISAVLKKHQKLITFEPNPISFAAASRTIALNKLANVQIFNVAVGETMADRKLEVSRRGVALGGSSRIVAKDATLGKAVETVAVAMVTIDSLIPKDKRISILHLDIEGFEVSALKGARKVIAAYKPTIILEGTDQAKVDEFLSILNDISGAGVYRHAGSMEHNSFFSAA